MKSILISKPLKSEKCINLQKYSNCVTFYRCHLLNASYVTNPLKKPVICSRPHLLKSKIRVQTQAYLTPESTLLPDTLSCTSHICYHLFGNPGNIYIPTHTGLGRLLEKNAKCSWWKNTILKSSSVDLIWNGCPRNDGWMKLMPQYEVVSNIAVILDGGRGQGFSESGLHSFTGLHLYVSCAQTFGPVMYKAVTTWRYVLPIDTWRNGLGTNCYLEQKSSSEERGNLGWLSDISTWKRRHYRVCLEQEEISAETGRTSDLSVSRVSSEAEGLVSQRQGLEKEAVYMQVAAV